MTASGALGVAKRHGLAFRFGVLIKGKELEDKVADSYAEFL